MTIENAVRLMAGIMVLLSVVLMHYVHAHFIWLTVFVGIMLVQSVFTGFCPAQNVFKMLGLKSSADSCSTDKNCC